MSAGTWKKIGLVCLIVAVVAAFFALGLHERLSLESIKASREELVGLFDRRPLLVLGGYVAIYLVVVGLNLPGALVLGLLAGALFGSIAGTVIVSFASSIGATLACALARYLLRDTVQRRFGSLVRRVDRGVREEGAFYLFSMRLIPMIPFFAINLVMGLTAMPLRTFYWVSQLGMLPGTFVFVNAGSQLAQIDSLSGILSPGLLVSFILLGLFPLVAKKVLDYARKRRSGGEAPTTEVSSSADLEAAFAGTPDTGLAQAARAVAESCTECQACVRQCGFLTRFGTPKAIAESLGNGGNGGIETDPYQCSLCNLCAAVCPEGVDPGAMLLEMRRQAVARDTVDMARYKVILGYENRGHSDLFAWYGLGNGDGSRPSTVFFPGCTLPGTRPGVVQAMIAALRETIPDLGVVLDCCHKPSHDLGRQAFFEERFGSIMDRLRAAGVKQVLTACPNCHKIFSRYGQGLEARTVWQHFAEQGAEHGGPPGLSAGLAGEPVEPVEVVFHDPCPLRQAGEVHQAARELARSAGLEVAKTRHEGARTLCCGEGGSVGFCNPDLAKGWGAKRVDLAQGRPVLTYCAGCAGFLSRAGARVVHLGELLFDPQGPHTAMAGKAKVAKAPFTYLHRLRLKGRLKRASA